MGRLRRVYVHLVRAPGAPKEVALGMAIGLFASLIPVPAQMLLAIAFVEVIRRVTGVPASRVAAAIGVWFTNPITAPPIYVLSLLIGRPIARLFLEAVGADGVVFGAEGSWLREIAPLESTLALGAGAVVLGIPLAIVGYEVTRRGILSYQHRRMVRQRARALRAVGLDPEAITLPAPSIQGPERAAQ